MANPEHLTLLKKGVETWNAWREENSDVRPDLTDAVLWGAVLTDSKVGSTVFADVDLSSVRGLETAPGTSAISAAGKTTTPIKRVSGGFSVT